MSQNSSLFLHLHLFGSVKTLNCSPDFNLSQLEQYLTIQRAMFADDAIHAKIHHLKRPFSELLKQLGEKVNS